MKISKINEAIPFIGTTMGGIVIGVIGRNGFVEWTGETLTAGLLGLGGGYFALIAAKHTQQRNENKAAYRFASQVILISPGTLNGVNHAIQQLLANNTAPNAILNANVSNAVDVVREKIISNLSEPTENAPADLQISYDQLMLTTQLHLDPSNPGKVKLNKAQAIDLLGIMKARLEDLIYRSHQCLDELHRTFK